MIVAFSHAISCHLKTSRLWALSHQHQTQAENQQGQADELPEPGIHEAPSFNSLSLDGAWFGHCFSTSCRTEYN